MFTKKRSDGTYIRDLPHFTRMMPYLMPRRSDATIFLEQDFDVTEAMRYLRAANGSGGPDGRRTTLFQVFLCASVRTIALRPKLNRFIAGYRYYQRNRIVFNFVAKKELSDEGVEINATLAFSPFETLSTVTGKVSGYVSGLKKGAGTKADRLNEFVAKLPRWAIRLVVRCYYLLDYWNGLPASAINELPFFASVFFTNVGSIGMDAPLHHSFEFGTCGLFVAIGKLRRENVLADDGSARRREKIRVTFTYDDRIADGFYCGRAIDLLRFFVEHPSALEQPPVLSEAQLEDLALKDSPGV